jgi:integrase
LLALPFSSWTWPNEYGVLPEIARQVRELWRRRLANLGVGHRASFIKAFKTACKKAGCPGRLPHDMRRSSVRNLVRAGVPQSVAMKLTGHKTHSVFRRYDIVSPDDLRVAVERLDAATA